MADGLITRDDLAPLLRGSWRGTRAAFACLWAHALVVDRATRLVFLKCGMGCPVFSDSRDFAQETLLALVEKADLLEGLTPPDDCQPGQDLTAWLYTVVRNQAFDVVKRALAKKRYVPIADGVQLERVAVSLEDATAGSQGRQHDLAVVDERMEHLLDSGVPPVCALAWVLLNRPALLRRVLVERACAQTPRGHLEYAIGLARDVEETWRLLLEWAPRNGLDPGASDSRLELAWILRTTNRQSPQAWRAGAPDEAATARDTLRKWENRFRKEIGALAEEGER